MVVRDVPVERVSGAARALSARPAPLAFEMVGLHWRGSGDVWFRTARAPGGWSSWKPARPEGEDLPDRASGEGAATAGWKLGNPYWTGPARWIQYRLSGRVTRVRAFFLTVSTAAPLPAAEEAAARPARPAIIRRAQWNADESIVRGSPAYAERVRLAVVHHTAGTNSYTRAQSAGIVRGIQRYHVLANGWNDIGYNFLVDRYGQVFEGRAGGLERNVVGAHARGFNAGSVGVAVLGTYGSATVSSAGRTSVERLLAWRLDVAHVDPVSALTAISYGNERFEAGTAVRLRAISGHRDTGYTSCPGTRLYGELGAIARSVATIGLPKLYSPEVAGGLGGPVRFTARLSSSRPWLVTVRDGSGTVVAEGRGSGTIVDWTWDSSSAPVDRYSYVIGSGSDVRPASGLVPGPPPLAIGQAAVTPAALTPNGDRSAERARVSFSLSRRAVVRVTVLRARTRVKMLLDDREVAGGPASVIWDATSDAGAPVADGRYRVRLAATVGSEQVVLYRRVVVDRTLAQAGAAPTPFSPNGDRRRERITFAYELTRPADLRVQILRRGRAAGTIFSAAGVPAGAYELLWDGRLHGTRLATGRYAVSVQVTTGLGTRVLARRFHIDTARPALRVLGARVVRGVTRLRFALGEPARVTIWYGTSHWSDGDSRRLEGRPAGERRYRRRGVFGVVRVVARDAAGNRSRAIVAAVRQG